MGPVQKRKFAKVIPPPDHLVNSRYGSIFLNYASVLNRANETREALITQVHIFPRERLVQIGFVITRRANLFPSYFSFGLLCMFTGSRDHETL